MNVFFSPEVHTYSVIATHSSIYTIIQKLISTGHIEFQLSKDDQPSDPYFIIAARIKIVKNKINKLIEFIQDKFHEKISQLTENQKIQVILKMKCKMQETHMDHLNWLDTQQSCIEQYNKQFNTLSNNYDSIQKTVSNIQQQIDLIQAKLQLKTNDYSSEQFVMIHGICANQSKNVLERMLFRKTQGYSYTIFKNRQNSTENSIFICFINRSVYVHIENKINVICSCNDIRLYELPSQKQFLVSQKQKLIIKWKEYSHLLELSERQFTLFFRKVLNHNGQTIRNNLTRINYLYRLVSIISHSKQIGNPKNFVQLTFHTPSGQVLPELGMPILPLQDSTRFRHLTIMPRLPCLFQVNLLTQLYSIPAYNEIIPSAFMLMSVPMLFGMMFSDIGHGLMLLCCCWGFKLGTLFYLMSFMSIYCGVIYNQFFGMKIIPSGIGVDPQWGIAINALNFQNSLKMKISMIFAFVHILFGLILKIINQKHKGQIRYIFFDSLPKIGLLFTTVGYLVLLIVLKWLKNFHGRENYAPSIINSMLELYLGWNQTRNHSIFKTIAIQKQIGSYVIKMNIFFIAVLIYNHTLRTKFDKIYTRFSNKNKKKYQNQSKNNLYHNLEQDENQIINIDRQISLDLQQSTYKTNKQLNQTNNTYYSEDQPINEIGILEIFQYILNLISSTTSYLRLFALSLAHQKLSNLLINFLLSTLMHYHPYISIIRCLIFFIVTIAMILILDCMECLMHVVRLHWVEWMGKFYTGNGRLFQPQIQQHYS